MGKYDPYAESWTPSATVYWKRGNEKHLTFVDGGITERYADRGEAETHAMSKAVAWCDENIPGELLKAPR